MSRPVFVRPLMRVVANGRRREGGKSWLKFTLVATPQSAAQGEEGAIEFSKWPAGMAGLFERGADGPFLGRGSMALEVRGEDEGETAWRRVSASLRVPVAYADAAQWQQVSELWANTIAPEDNDWEPLALDIARSLEGTKRTTDLSATHQGQPKLDADGAIIYQPPAEKDPPVAVKGVVPIRQSDFAIEEESERAARILAKMFKGPNAVSDLPGEPAPAFRKQTYAEVASQANAERDIAVKLFAQIKGTLENPTADAVTVPERTSAKIMPLPDLILDGTVDKCRQGERGQRRASHQYGTWLQRRYDIKPGKAAPVVGTDETRAAEAEDFDRVRGLYYSLQGDPALSRLFCLAADLEIEEDVFGATVPAENLHLSVVGWTADRRRVATAARRSSEGFWPYSAFHRVLPGLVEQEHGIWKLGATTPATDGAVARYDLASLDLRRSIDSKTIGFDRGEAQQTGGFTLLDRGRADQITRDLAMAAINAEVETGTVVLHAEELTIGRHLDISALPAATPLDQIEWRSLTHRFVDYDFGDSERAAEGLLERLLGSKWTRNGLLDETAFQVVARMLPLGSSAGAGFEAVAEEAIYLWDGTPASVLTNAASGNKRTAVSVPFDRTYRLPGHGEAASRLRPAPLRFGVPYAFRARSMFLGGGSPSAGDDDTRSNTDIGDMLPAGVKSDAHGNLARPRRFLRHEHISGPILMLPKAIADLRYAQMGYEQADQAIVRTWNEAFSDIVPGDELDVIKGAYVGGSVRRMPDQTMRIFVAPEAPLDTVARHGELDRADAEEIRRGGLRNVTYAPLRHSDADQPVPGGFPVVVTRRRATLDAEGAAYRRYLDPAPVEERGVPVFEAGGTNSTRLGETGYLPDPAIANFVIRARLRGSGRYLEGHIEVPLYKDSTYPHALPLVVEVLRRGGAAPRRPVATRLDEIASAPELAWLDHKSIVRRSRPSKGTRIQLVSLRLFAGEDYDLEVVCLPSPAMLADRFSVTETMAIMAKDGTLDQQSALCLAALGGEEATKMCAFDDEQLLTGLGGRGVPDRAALLDVAAGLTRTMQTRWPIEEIASVTTLRVCNALNKFGAAVAWPQEPGLSFREIPEEYLELLCSPKPASQESLILEGQVQVDLDLCDSFEIVAKAAGADGRVDSAERGRSMVSKRSGRWPLLVRNDGKRAYVLPKDVVGFDVEEDGSVVLPQQTVTLLKVSNLPKHGAIGELVDQFADGGVCDVAPDYQLKVTPPGQHPGRPVFVSSEGRMTSIALGPLFTAAYHGSAITQQLALQSPHDTKKQVRQIKVECPRRFDDKLAHRLLVSVVGISRFSSTFETEPAYFEGKEQLLYRRQPLKRADQAVVSNEVEVWIPARARPAAVDAKRPEPSFVITRGSTPTTAGISHQLVRRALTRIYLGRGWNEGERLGVVLWPPGYDALKEADVDADRIRFNGRSMSLRDFEDADLGPGGAFVSRWGGDPIRLDGSPQSGHLIPPTAFADIGRGSTAPHWHRLEPKALLPIRRQLSTDSEEAVSEGKQVEFDFLPVSLLTFVPCFDLDREEWYVDVDLRPIRASEPFVRFGLVRYQEHSTADDLRVSEPVTITMQLLPGRNVEVLGKRAPSGDHQIKIVVQGLASLDIQELQPEMLDGAEEDKIRWKASFDELRRPKIMLTVFHEAHGTDGPVRTQLLPDAADESNSESPDYTSHPDFRVVEPVIENETLFWRANFDLPRADLVGLGAGRIVAYLEEIDRRMPASYRNEPVRPQDIFDRATFVSSGPRFSARIPFLEVTADP